MNWFMAGVLAAAVLLAVADARHWLAVGLATTIAVPALWLAASWFRRNRPPQEAGETGMRPFGARDETPASRKDARPGATMPG